MTSKLSFQAILFYVAAGLGAVLFLTGAGGIAQGQAKGPSASETAEYRIVFNATWDPNGVPNPHFSPLVGAAHNGDTVIWQTGELASNGIEVMAETGNRNPLLDEINANGNVDIAITGGPIPTSPDSTTINSVTIDHDFPLITLVTMIAPSPDWFVGVSGLSLLDEQGEWMNEIVVPLFPYDSGTDDGPDFTSGDDDSDPAEAIFRINDSDLFPVETLGTFTFTRIDEPDPTLTPTSTATAVPTETQTLVPTETATAIPTETIVPTATSTAAPNPEMTPTPVATEPPVEASPTPDVPFVATDFVYLPIVAGGE